MDFVSERREYELSKGLLNLRQLKLNARDVRILFQNLAMTESLGEEEKEEEDKEPPKKKIRLESQEKEVFISKLCSTYRITDIDFSGNCNIGGKFVELAPLIFPIIFSPLFFKKKT